MDIYESIRKVCNKIKNQPSSLGLFLLDVLVTIIYFPKYLYYLIKQQKVIAFDWRDGLFGDFYLPLFEELDKYRLQIIFFFNFGYVNRHEMTIFKRGLPRLYERFLDNKIVICATSTDYAKLSKTVRIQIFHGLSSFGTVWQKSYIDCFDVLFLVTKFQWQQLQEENKEMAEGKKIFKIGYPKIDKYISLKERDKSEGNNHITLFYGPTYHREISSIFKFLPVIVELCQKNNYRLIIKLHPFLYHKHNYEKSGGINWAKKIYEYKKNYNDIVFLRGNKNDLGKYFRITDIFLTDVSGIGFEFVLVTSKPVIFLGDKLKVPLEDLRKGNIKKYENCPEIYYRERIGPIVKKPEELEEAVRRILRENTYEDEIKKFRGGYVFNLGTATEVAAAEIKKIYEEL